MRTYLFVIFLSILVFCASCSSTLPDIDQPIENYCLIIGSIIFDVDGYQDVNTTFRENVEVAIVGSVIDKGREKRVGYWAETDENGYFYLANVPPGVYALKGFRVNSMDLGNVTIVNELTDPQRNYFILSTSGAIPMTGNLLDVKSEQRIVNFEHNIFTLYRNGLVNFKRKNQLRDYKLSAGDVVDLPPVPSYFLENFPDSPWAKFLTLRMN